MVFKSPSEVQKGEGTCWTPPGSARFPVGSVFLPQNIPGNQQLPRATCTSAGTTGKVSVPKLPDGCSAVAMPTTLPACVARTVHELCRYPWTTVISAILVPDLPVDVLGISRPWIVRVPAELWPRSRTPSRRVSIFLSDCEGTSAHLW